MKSPRGCSSKVPISSCSAGRRVPGTTDSGARQPRHHSSNRRAEDSAIPRSLHSSISRRTSASRSRPQRGPARHRPDPHHTPPADDLGEGQVKLAVQRRLKVTQIITFALATAVEADVPDGGERPGPGLSQKPRKSRSPRGTSPAALSASASSPPASSQPERRRRVPAGETLEFSSSSSTEATTPRPRNPFHQPDRIPRASGRVCSPAAHGGTRKRRAKCASIDAGFLKLLGLGEKWSSALELPGSSLAAGKGQAAEDFFFLHSRTPAGVQRVHPDPEADQDAPAGRPGG